MKYPKQPGSLVSADGEIQWLVVHGEWLEVRLTASFGVRGRPPLATTDAVRGEQLDAAADDPSWGARVSAPLSARAYSVVKQQRLVASDGRICIRKNPEPRW